MHTNGIDGLVARFGVGDDNIRWTIQDRQMSVYDVLDVTGTTKDAIAYTAVGKIVSQTDSAELGRIAYTGRKLDAETGNQLHRARYYQTDISRWMSENPSASVPTVNWPWCLGRTGPSATLAGASGYVGFRGLVHLCFHVRLFTSEPAGRSACPEKIGKS